MKKRIWSIMPLIFLMMFSACKVSVNKSVYIDDGRRVSGGATSINGSVFIGSECQVRGTSRSINGRVEVGRNSKVGDIQTVNGRIELDRGVRVHGDVQSVNGAISCDAETEIRGDLSSINGDINLEETRVGRNLITYNGDINLLQESVVEGDIIIKRNKGNSSRQRRLVIEITDGSRVMGNIENRDPDIDVLIVLSEGGKVDGRIRGCEVEEE